MLINLSNHPSAAWSVEQMQAAVTQFGGVEDIPFPNINPADSSEDIRDLVETYAGLVAACFMQPDAQRSVHIMGEMTFVHTFVNRLSPHGVHCYASTTERTVLEEADGRKTVQFRFVQFRRYQS
jgi:hypothetical protein